MPATPSFPTRRGSMRTRIAAATSSQQGAALSKPGTTTLTKLQSSPQQTLAQQRSASIPGRHARPGRPRKDTTPVPAEDPDRPRKSRGRPPKAREDTTEPSTPPASASRSSSVEHEQEQEQEHEEEIHSPSSSAKNIQMDVDTQGIASHSHPATRRLSSQRHATRQSISASKEAVHSSERSSGNNSSSRGSEAPSGGSEAPQERAQSIQVSEDREMEDASSESEDDESDDDHRERGSTKNKHQKGGTTPAKRRLRSSRLIPSVVVAHLAVDSNGLSMDQILDEYTEEQQLLRANTSAAEALTRLFRQGIQESENLHPDMVDTQDYELIRHTFGEIEDLNLNLTGTLLTQDESSIEDDELTRDLKQKHRNAKHSLMDVSAEYKAAKRSMRIKMSAQLDAEEAQIKAGTHPELLAELKAIEDRREARTKVVQAQRDYLQRMWDINFQAVCKAANDQYRAGQVTARRDMMDLVQSRMNRIKQEMAQSRRAAGIPSPRRLTYVRPLEVTGYDSCGESCSSYDSYTSSGSECSDCEICKPPRQLQIPQLKTPKGLSRREVAVDLAFLFPESSSSSSLLRHPEEYTTPQNLSGPSRQHSPEGDEAARGRISKNQQYMIDHLNDEKRRKRRVIDREMQNKAAYKKHSVGDKGGKGGEGGGEDMDIEQDQGQDPDQQEHEFSATQSAAESSSHQHSPIFARKIPRLTPNKNAKYYRPRFLPGFGPNGLQGHSRPKESLGSTHYKQKYPFVERYSRPWDPSRHGVPPPSTGHRSDVRPFPLIEREVARMHGVRPPHEQYHQERNGGYSVPPQHDPRQPSYQHYYQGQQPHRYPEHADAQLRPHYPQDQRVVSSVIPHSRQLPPTVPRFSLEAVYPFDDKTMTFKNPKTASHRRVPPPVNPATAKERPPKDLSALPRIEPVTRYQGVPSGTDGDAKSLAHPSASPHVVTNGSSLGQHEGRHGGAAVEESPDKLEGAMMAKEHSEATNENAST